MDQIENTAKETETKIPENPDTVTAVEYVRKSKKGYKIFRIAVNVGSVLITLCSFAFAFILGFAIGFLGTMLGLPQAILTAVGASAAIIVIVSVSFLYSLPMGYVDRLLMYLNLKKLNCDRLTSIQCALELLNGKKSRKALRLLNYSLDAVYILGAKENILSYCVMEIVSLVCILLYLLAAFISLPVIFLVPSLISAQSGYILALIIALVVIFILQLLFITLPRYVIFKIQTKQLLKMKEDPKGEADGAAEDLKGENNVTEGA